MDGSSRELMMEAHYCNTVGYSSLHLLLVSIAHDNDISLDYKLQVMVECPARCQVMILIY